MVNSFSFRASASEEFQSISWPGPHCVMFSKKMVSRIDNFFGLVKGPICSHLKSKFDIVKQLDLGGGPLAGITSPAVSGLQSKFNSEC